MTGVYTDNQPDFSWLAPFEEKSFTQYFMPFKGIGGVKNASREAAINLDVQGQTARVGVYVTWPHEDLTVRLLAAGGACFERELKLSPEAAFVENVTLPVGIRPADLRLVLLAADGREIVSYAPELGGEAELPEPAPLAKAPREIETNEELYLTGLHLEQYRHALFDAEPYYREALARDPLDARCNNALGLLLYRRGRFADAETHFRRAIERLTWRNQNPYDGEPHYNLGLTLKMQGRYDEAYAAFYKAAWNGAWQDAAYFELARIACGQGRYEEALDLVDRSLTRNWHHHKARHLKAALFRELGRFSEARREALASLDLDALDFGARNELYLAAKALGDRTGEQERLGELERLMRAESHNHLELASDYAQAGLYDSAIELLKRFVRQRPGESSGDISPLVFYHLGYYHVQAGGPHGDEWFARAAAAPPDYCFPNRLESLLALETAVGRNPIDSRGYYYLGNLWYSKRQYDRAIQAWEKSRGLNEAFPTVHRNLGLAYWNKRGDRAAALAAYEKAFALGPTDARVLYELDQLRKRLGHSPADRLALLERNLELVEARDDLYIEYVILHSQLRRHEEAMALLLRRRFHPWEGGEGKVTGQYVLSLVQLARRCLAEGRPDRAIEMLHKAQSYPANLGEGKLAGAQENHVHFLLGLGHEALGHAREARAAFERAAVGPHEPKSAQYYNDQPPDMIYYQGWALLKLGRVTEGEDRFRRLIAYGQDHLDDAVGFDYFAVSMPDFLVFEDDLTRKNRIHCHYMRALGHLGLGETARARAEFDEVLGLDGNHLGAIFHRPEAGL
jgi:tetratricopeptide (TPR) repeat protein